MEHFVHRLTGFTSCCAIRCIPDPPFLYVLLSLKLSFQNCLCFPNPVFLFVCPSVCVPLRSGDVDPLEGSAF